MLPLAANATLTRISGDGTAEDYRDPEGADTTTRFAGSAALWVNDVRELVVAGDGLNVVSERQLVVGNSIGVAAPQVGDNVTYDRRGQTFTAEIVALKEYTWDDALIGWRLWLGEK